MFLLTKKRNSNVREEYKQCETELLADLVDNN